MGAKKHSEILKLKKIDDRILTKSSTVILHCITNYPLNPINSKINYISTIKKIFRNYKIGYSSHESEIFNAIYSLSKKIDFLERHITLSKNSKGLDHSSSSDPEEIAKLAFYCNSIDIIDKKHETRNLNQGEKLNLQNLRSIF